MDRTILRSILAGTDLGVTGSAVLRSAARPARECGAALHLVHAFNPGRDGEPG